MANAKENDMDFFEKLGHGFGLINESWEAFKLNWTTFLMVWIAPFTIMLLLVPMFILPVVVQRGGVIGVASILLALVALFFLALVLLILAPAMTVTQIESVKGNKISFADAFDKGRKYMFNFVLAALLSLVVIVGPLILSMLLLIVLIGVFLLPFAIIWMFVAPFFLMLVPFIVVTKNAGPAEAIRQSYKLSITNWQWILTIYIVLAAIAAVSPMLNFIPIFGQLIGLGLIIAYFCMPAYIFVHYINQNNTVYYKADTKSSDSPKPASKKTVAKTTRKSPPKKTSKPKKSTK